MELNREILEEKNMTKKYILKYPWPSEKCRLELF